MAYKVLSNITHEGLLHEAGEVIELTAEVAENLIERGLVEVTDELAKVEVAVETKEVETAADPLVPPTDGPSETSEQVQTDEPPTMEPTDQPSNQATPTTPPSSETTSTNLHLG